VQVLLWLKKGISVRLEKQSIGVKRVTVVWKPRASTETRKRQRSLSGHKKKKRAFGRKIVGQNVDSYFIRAGGGRNKKGKKTILLDNDV